MSRTSSLFVVFAVRIVLPVSGPYRLAISSLYPSICSSRRRVHVVGDDPWSAQGGPLLAGRASALVGGTRGPAYHSTDPQGDVPIPHPGDEVGIRVGGLVKREVDAGTHRVVVAMESSLLRPGSWRRFQPRSRHPRQAPPLRPRMAAGCATSVVRDLVFVGNGCGRVQAGRVQAGRVQARRIRACLVCEIIHNAEFIDQMRASNGPGVQRRGGLLLPRMVTDSPTGTVYQ
jgi:hypothetical protein